MRQFTCKLRYTPDQRFSAVTGVLYGLDPSDGLLHRTASNGELGLEAGVEDADAAQFAAIPSVWTEVIEEPQVTEAPVQTPVPPPAPPQAPPAPALKVPEEPPAPQALPVLPDTYDAMTDAQWEAHKGVKTIKEWVKAAADDGLGLSPEAQATRPKLDLVKLIYASAKQAPTPET